MKMVLFFSLIFSISAFAKEEVWKMGDHFFELSNDEKIGLLISKNCQKKNCEALKFIKKVSLKNISSDKLSGGKNPGAVLCHDSKIGEVIFLKDLNGNDNSFCLFKDKSMISSASIENQARKNDEK